MKPKMKQCLSDIRLKNDRIISGVGRLSKLGPRDYIAAMHVNSPSSRCKNFCSINWKSN